VDLLVQLLGAAVVVVVLQHGFFTVLFPGSGHGLVRRPLPRWVWTVLPRLPYRSPQSRRGLLSYNGPVQIAVTIVVWLLLLVLGWALVFQPALGNGVVASIGTTDTGWAPAIYFSGFALTTLGTGDLVPATGAYQLLTVTEAAVDAGNTLLRRWGSAGSSTQASSEVRAQRHSRLGPAQAGVPGRLRPSACDQPSAQPERTHPPPLTMRAAPSHQPKMPPGRRSVAPQHPSSTAPPMSLDNAPRTRPRGWPARA